VEIVNGRMGTTTMVEGSDSGVTYDKPFLCSPCLHARLGHLLVGHVAFFDKGELGSLYAPTAVYLRWHDCVIPLAYPK
jgi:hypothetical protein